MARSGSGAGIAALGFVHAGVQQGPSVTANVLGAKVRSMKIKCLGLCVLLAACGVPEGTGEPSAATPTTGDLVEYISTDAIFLCELT